MALDLIAELEALLDQLEREGVEYALCGGLALAIHGHPRATMDIDLLVPPEQVEAAKQAARQVGFDLPARKMTFGMRSPSPREVHRLSKLDQETGNLLSLDLLVVAEALRPVWEGRIRVGWRDRQLTTVSRAGLAIMKRLAGRPQDLVDVAALEGTDDEVDDT